MAVTNTIPKQMVSTMRRVGGETPGPPHRDAEAALQIPVCTAPRVFARTARIWLSGRVFAGEEIVIRGGGC